MTETTTQKQTIFYLELPGQEVKGAFTEDNKVILLKHRDVLIKIEDPNIQKLRVTCSDKEFYAPKLKHLVKKYEFNQGEEFHFWLARSFAETIKIEKQTAKGWSVYQEIPIKAFDSHSYTDIEHCPAPITIIQKQIPQDTGLKMASAHESFTSAMNGGQRVRKYDPASPQPYSCLTWSRNEFAQAVNSASQGPDVVYAEVDFAFFSNYISGKFEEGREYLISKFQNEAEYLEAKLQQKRATGYAPVGPEFHGSFQDAVKQQNKDDAREYGEKIPINSTMRTLLVVFFNQLNERGLLWLHLIGTKMTYYSRETKQGTKYFVKISGYAGLRKLVRASNYLVCGKNVVKPLTMGFGSFRDTVKYAAEDLASMRNIKTVTGRWLYVGFLVETAAWMAKGGQDVDELIATLITTGIGVGATVLLAPIAAKVLIGSITFATEALAGVTMTTISLPAVVVAIGGILFVLGVGLLIDQVLEELGVKEFILKYIKELREFYAKMAEKDPDWLKWSLYNASMSMAY